MSKRPNFEAMGYKALLVSVAESHYDLKERLEGNGQPGMCHVHSRDIQALRMFVGKVKTAGWLIGVLFSGVIGVLGVLFARGR